MNGPTKMPEATAAWLLNYKSIIAIRESKAFSANQRLVLVMIASCGDESFPSQEKLASYSGLSRATVSKIVKELRDLGAIQTDGHGRSLTYRLSPESIESVSTSAVDTCLHPMSTRVDSIEKGKSDLKKDLESPNLDRSGSGSEWKRTHDAVIARYEKDYLLCTGMKPMLDKLTHKAAWDLAKLLPEEEAVDLVDAAFENDFFRTKQRQLWIILKNINQYRRPLQRQQPKVVFLKRQQPVAPSEPIHIESPFKDDD